MTRPATAFPMHAARKSRELLAPTVLTTLHARCRLAGISISVGRGGICAVLAAVEKRRALARWRPCRAFARLSAPLSRLPATVQQQQRPASAFASELVIRPARASDG